MSHLEIDGYSHLASPIHRWDPRVKIASLLLLTFSIVLLKSLAVALLGLASSAAILLISRLPFSYVLQGIKWPLLFLLPFPLILPLTVDGESFFILYGLGFSIEGLEQGLVMMTRGVAAVVLIYPIFGSSPFNTTVHAMRSLGLPEALTQIFLFAYRYLFLLREEFASTSRSLASRGFIKGTDAASIRVLGAALGMLFIRSYERSERIYRAMVSKGYGGDLPSADRFRMEGRDLLKALIVLGLALGLQGLDWMVIG
ncbi:MAG: Energy-coupling factor transporter transmembrane protein EcfT [Methanosaeta sp. PtaU1.Bin055]|jgi:cobalt/nickel transport system permease protein|nr:MAG: Energy-coupling factor transporter transmembrane protein EcfT [Methanosaeta sp. PtaU1.Bin055]